MTDLFTYPMSFPGWFIDYYDFFTWCLILVVLSGIWVVFFRFGKFSYGLDFGCVWKSALMIIATTICIGSQRILTVKFEAKHGHDGDVVRLADDRIEYRNRNGEKKMFLLKDIVSIYQEQVTYNPPPKIFIVAKNAGLRDSINVTEGQYGLPNADKLLSALSAKTGLPVKRP